MYLFSIISSKPAAADTALVRGLSNREARRAFQRQMRKAYCIGRVVIRRNDREILFADGERIHIG